MEKILFKKILYDCSLFFLISLVSASIVVWVFQAVNFLDIMIEDGRDYAVYINYTLLNFPKIISKILPFALFFSFSYVITKYELNNEMIIFWNFGISKVQLMNFFLRISIILMIFPLDNLRSALGLDDFPTIPIKLVLSKSIKFLFVEL